MDAHERAVALANANRARDLNEADTRALVIDEVLFGVLAWPKASVTRECYVDPGYLDYGLLRSDGKYLIVVEAKKEGVFFRLPDNLVRLGDASYVKVSTLLTDQSILKAITQVHGYCISVGCAFGAITNGHEWIFFRTFEQGQDWRSLRALVISGLDYFVNRFTEAVNSIGFSAIKDRGMLRQLLAGEPAANRPMFFPKDKITAFAQNLRGNYLAGYLRPLMDSYFGTLDTSDPEMMDFCYVQSKPHAAALKDAYSVLEDSLTPYLEQYRVAETENTESGGRFGNRVAKSVLATKAKDVVVLFGSKGVGKSTFIKRLFFHRAPQVIKKNAAVALVDLLKIAHVKERIDEAIWDAVIVGLDKDSILSAERPVILQLFAREYEIAKKQVLWGLDENSEAYNIRLNELVAKWLSNRRLIASALAEYWRVRHKGVVVVIDNTDQFDQELQEFCFAAAHEISKELGCLVIIAMREERFYASTIRGTLDAFQNSGFHLAAPSARDVFTKRIEFVQKLLAREDGRVEALGADVPQEYEERIRTLFGVFDNEFRNKNGHLTDFLSACAQGNIRLALEMFRNFVTSRYTNVYEMTEVGAGWILQVHQVLKPIMMPDRVFYDETLSRVPNIFRVRSRSRGSHFTAYRILRLLAEGNDPQNPKYLSVPTIREYFGDIFQMEEDFQLNLDVLLRYRLVEAANGMDSYSPVIDGIRLTRYGVYFYTDLSKFFSYLELISTDSAVFDESVSNDLVTLSNDEYRLWEESLKNPEVRVERVEKRVAKAESFVAYLEAEEAAEVVAAAIENTPRIMPAIRQSFELEKPEVMKSARRQKYTKSA